MYTVGLRDSLKQLLHEQQYQLTETTLTELQGMENVTDFILVDEQAVSTTDLFEYRTEQPDTRVIFVSDELTPAKETFSLAHQIFIIESHKVLPYLDSQGRARSGQPVLTFWGVLPQLGTTTLALSVGSYLASERGLNVGVLGLNVYNPGTWIVSNPSHYLDDLKSFIRLKQLTATKLRNSVDTLPSGVKYLVGNRNQTVALDYRMEDIQYLISVAQESFEVVILDAGSILNTAPALQSLLSATVNYVVGTDLIHIQEAFHTHSQNVLKPLGIRTEDMLLIGNRVKQPKNVQSFAKAMGVTPIGAIKEYSELPYWAENNPDKIKQFMENKDFRKVIEQITEGIAATSSMAAVALR